MSYLNPQNFALPQCVKLFSYKDDILPFSFCFTLLSECIHVSKKLLLWAINICAVFQGAVCTTGHLKRFKEDKPGIQLYQGAEGNYLLYYMHIFKKHEKIIMNDSSGHIILNVDLK